MAESCNESHVAVSRTTNQMTEPNNESSNESNVAVSRTTNKMTEHNNESSNESNVTVAVSRTTNKMTEHNNESSSESNVAVSRTTKKMTEHYNESSSESIVAVSRTTKKMTEHCNESSNESNVAVSRTTNKMTEPNNESSNEFNLAVSRTTNKNAEPNNESSNESNLAVSRTTNKGVESSNESNVTVSRTFSEEAESKTESNVSCSRTNSKTKESLTECSEAFNAALKDVEFSVAASSAKSQQVSSSFYQIELNVSQCNEFKSPDESESLKNDEQKFYSDPVTSSKVQDSDFGVMQKGKSRMQEVKNDACNNISDEIKQQKLLDQLITKLNMKESDWPDALSKIMTIIRDQNDRRRKTEYISILLNGDVSQKLKLYLETRESISVCDFISREAGNSNQCWPTVKRLLIILWLACDGSVNFCQHFIASDTYQLLLKDLKLCGSSVNLDSDMIIFTVKAILGMLHNVCRHFPNCRWKLREDGLVSLLNPFLKSKIPMIQVKSLMILSYILSEAENELINSEDANFVFIFEVLNDALQIPTHMSSRYGMSVSELLKGLNNLALNDENKIRIVQNGGLALFQQVLETCTTCIAEITGDKMFKISNRGPEHGEQREEIKLTMTLLWSLAFHHYNKMKMREMPGIMTKVEELQQCGDEEICHAARGTFWELQHVGKSSIGTRGSSSSGSDCVTCQPHIMISYQWDSQPVMLKVKDRLQHAGYKVWMDVEHMTGSTLEAMALAVERAAVVLICMSQKYKESPNCRTEAEYVYRLRKDFVPLRLQKEYVPDGWLGILVGTRLYFDIFKEDLLDIQIPRLAREIGERGKPALPRDYVDHVPMRLTSREAVPLIKADLGYGVISWTGLDVKQWLASCNLEGLQERFEEIDGCILLELQKVQDTAPEYFHRVLRDDFNMSFLAALKFSRCLRSLT